MLYDVYCLSLKYHPSKQPSKLVQFLFLCSACLLGQLMNRSSIIDHCHVSVYVSGFLNQLLMCFVFFDGAAGWGGVMFDHPRSLKSGN